MPTSLCAEHPLERHDMQLVGILCLLLVVVTATVVAADNTELQLRKEFVQWMHRYNKKYSADEFQHKWQTWKANALWIRDFNTKEENRTFTVAMNKFGDLTNEEFSRIYMGLRQDASLRPSQRAVAFPADAIANLPAAVDWRMKGIVTGIKDQQNCGTYLCNSSSASDTDLPNAKVLVGLSLRQALWRVRMLKIQESLSACLNRISLIAALPKVTMGVGAAGWTMHSNVRIHPFTALSVTLSS